MPISVPNPYSGQDEETCSVSFAAQQQAVGGVSSLQTEAEYHKSKQLGEWGVIKAKLAKGEIPDGTKILSYEAPKTGIRGYFHVGGGGKLLQTFYYKGKKSSNPGSVTTAEGFIKNPNLITSIPQSVSPKVDAKLPAADPSNAPPPTFWTAAPVPAPAVNPGSPSEGSMSDEDVATMFVQVKDKLATEKGVNIKGANPALDAEVYKSIGKQTGYTAFEVKAKIEAYKATGKKLSALKKKTLKGASKTPDPKPHGVPTVATTTTTEKAKQEVKKVVEEKPKKLYSDEDIAAQYIIIKDAVVAASNGKWTLYTKIDEMDAKIYAAIEMTTGYNTLAAKTAIANYLASGKKLSQLKKSLAKQGVFTPKADTLKKSGEAKVEADKEKDIAAKAQAGYTPTPTPATGTPPVDTGKAAPKRVEKEAAENGDISGISKPDKAKLYQLFKNQGALSYLSSTAAQNYQGLLKAQSGSPYTLLQIVRLIDDQGAKKFGVENTHVFEIKVITWLTTPEGKKFLEDQKETLLKQAAKAKEEAELLAAAKKMEASQPPLPADSALFQQLTVDQAHALQAAMTRDRPWSAREKRDLKHYTGSNYTAMNGYLRGIRPNIDERNKNAIDGCREGMRPSPENILVHRGTGLSQFGIENENVIWALTGKTVEDKGFLSTSVGGRAAFGGKVLMEIEVPKGTPMAFVKSVSNYSSENEMLLQAGLKYKVLRVSVEGTGLYKKYVVRLRVVKA